MLDVHAARKSFGALTTLADVRWLTIVAIIALVSAVSLWTLSPRLEHTFPSMVDDWAAISRSPEQIDDALTLRNPEDLRYRPTWIAWNYVQWHTLGAPEDLTPPLAWDLLRVLALVTGLVVAAVVLTQRVGIGTLPRALLVAGAALVVVTIPAFAEDLARYGPQEPLLVGLLCAGGALFWLVVRRALDGSATTIGTAILGGLAVLLIWAGAGQKETSLCALVVLPFLWPAVRSQVPAFRALPSGIRRVLVGTFALAVAGFVPVFTRTVQLALADERIYGAEPEDGILRKLKRQLTEMDDELVSRTGWYLLGAAIALTVAAAVRRRTDWVGVGLLVSAFAFLVFASSTDVVASRYYLPTVALAALVVARSVAAFRREVIVAAGTLLLVGGLVQAPEARDVVDGWTGWEEKQEEIVREVARLDAGGCGVEVTGPDVEFVAALPVLVPLAREEAAGCGPGETFVAVLTGTSPWAEDPEDPPVVACGRSAVEVFRNDVGRVMRCST